MTEPASYLDALAREEWQRTLQEADRHNIFCHCRQCGNEWVASAPVNCRCGSANVQYIACWQFPDD